MKQPSVRLLMALPVALVLVALAALLLPDEAVASFGGIPHTGSIIVYVEDGAAGEPLPNASVAIPETGETYLTDADGKTAPIRVPILEDTEYGGILPKPWGEITLLIYKQGYADCAVFHVNIWEDQTRNGPTVLLFPLKGDEANEPFTLTEAPNRLWVKQLLGQYRPDAD